MTKRIPITVAKMIATTYDYDQVIVYARCVGDREWITTYGVTKQHCGAAAKIGDAIKQQVTPVVEQLEHIKKTLKKARDSGDTQESLKILSDLLDEVEEKDANTN